VERRLGGASYVETAEIGVMPTEVDFAAASALPVGGVTALRAVRALGSLLGRRLLVTGASGGVGRYAVSAA
jgi:NADPH2:quinone reductase